MMFLLGLMSSGLYAQQRSSSSTAVTRRDDVVKQPAKVTGVSDRLLSKLAEADAPGDNVAWLKVVYRNLDAENAANAALYYPELPDDGQECLFRIVMRLLSTGEVPAYEYLDGREVFSDDYRLDVKEMLDRFHVLYGEEKGPRGTVRLVIDDSDIPAGEVMSYYVIERWELDGATSRMHTVVEAICPVLHRVGDFGGEAIRYPMFWVRMSDLRPHLVQQTIFVDDDNNLESYTYDDFFRLGLYEGPIYKTRNLRNKSMAELYPDPDALKHAQDSIDSYLAGYEKKMWVPTREEVMSAREKNGLAASGDTIAVRKDTRSVKKNPRRASRAKRATRIKSSSSSADNRSVTRSVRSRK